jgi:Siphovirus Gp157
VKLYDIPIEFDKLSQILLETGGELTPEIKQSWKDLEVNSTEKVGAAACVLQSMKADSAALQAEIERLQSRKEANDNAQERLRAMLLPAVQALGGKVKTPEFTLSVVNKKNTVVTLKPTVDIWELPTSYYRVRDPDLNKADIKKLVADGQPIHEGVDVTETETTFLIVR